MSGGLWETDWWAQSCFLCSLLLCSMRLFHPSHCYTVIYYESIRSDCRVSDWLRSYRCDWIDMSVPVMMGGPNLITVIDMSCWASESLKTRSTSFLYVEKKRSDCQWMFNQLSWVEITYKQSKGFKDIHILYLDYTFTITWEVVEAGLRFRTS